MRIWTKNKIFFIGSLLILSGMFFGAPSILAYSIEGVPDVPTNLNDFVVGPTRNEFFLNPGESAVKDFYVMNRLGRTMSFKIQTEDFTGSYDPTQTVVLLGDQKGLYSLKDYLKPEITEFTLAHGQRINFKVSVNVPSDAEPGGRYGAILVSTNPGATSTENLENIRGSVTVKTRIASLFFVRVNGEVQANAYLKSFKLTNQARFYSKGPISFSLAYQNDGSIHVVPYGAIKIKNLLGKEVGEAPVDSFFSMPTSLRTREITWDKPWLWGRYTATLSLNRGYENIIDQKEVDFWVVPWKIMAVGLAAIILIVFIIILLLRKIEIKFKK